MYLNFRNFFFKNLFNLRFLRNILLVSGILLNFVGCSDMGNIIPAIAKTTESISKQSSSKWDYQVEQYESSFNYMQKIDADIFDMLASYQARFGLEDVVILSSNADCLLSMSYEFSPPDSLYPWLKETADCGHALMKQVQRVASFCADKKCLTGDKSTLTALHSETMLLLDQYLDINRISAQKLMEEKLILQEEQLSYAKKNNLQIEYNMIRFSQSIEELMAILETSVSLVETTHLSLENPLRDAEEYLYDYVNSVQKEDQPSIENLDKHSLTSLYKSSRKLLDTFSDCIKNDFVSWDSLSVSYKDFCSSFNETFAAK